MLGNTIILKKGDLRLTKDEYKKFKKGDSIWGIAQCPEELKRWSADQKDEAKAELAKYKCSYKEDYPLHNIEEYALEYCECDEDGEFVKGSDYELAKE